MYCNLITKLFFLFPGERRTMAETKDKRGEMLFIFGESWDSETPPLLPDLPSSFKLLSWSKHNLSGVRRGKEGIKQNFKNSIKDLEYIFM